MKRNLYQAVLAALVLLASAMANSQTTITIDAPLPAGDYVISPKAAPPPPEPDEETDPDPEPDPDPAPDPDPVDTGRPELGARGQRINDDVVGPYVATDSRIPAFTYVGGFRIPDGNFGVSSIKSTKGGFSVQIGESGEKTLWISGNRNDSRNVGAFALPDLADDPNNAVATNVVPFFSLAGVGGNHLTNVYRWGDWILASNTTSYDGGDDNRCYFFVVRPDGSDQQPCHGLSIPAKDAPEWRRQMSAGSFFEPPPEMVEQLGGSLCMHGEHWINIIGRYSAGPSLTCFYPDFPYDDGVVRPTAHMYYPIDHTIGQHGSSNLQWVPDARNPEGGEWKVRQRVSNPIFNRLARYEGCFIWMTTDSYVCVGLIAGQNSGDWYGPSKNQPKTHVQKGTHTGHPLEMPVGVTNPDCNPNAWKDEDQADWCIPKTAGESKQLHDMSNYVWIWPMSEILVAEKPWDPEPAEWTFFNDLVDRNPGRILGAYFDRDANQIYLLAAGGIVTVFQVG
ncbi:MAG: hypothetical protein AAFY29_22780 [Pseudomonadota bacterium]